MRRLRRAELEQMLKAYAEACSPASDEAARLAAWPELRRIARQNWALLMDSFRSGQNVSEAALWQLLPYKVTPLARSRGAFCHPAAAFRDDPRARFAGAGWIEEDDWPVIGQGLFEFVLRCDDYPPDLWQACEAFAALPGGRGFTSGMLSPILNALRPDDFMLVNASGRAVLNHYEGCSLTTALSDYSTANKAARELVSALRPKLQAVPFREIHPSDVFEGFCHWLVNSRMHPLEDAGVDDPHGDALDVMPTSLVGMRPIKSELPVEAVSSGPEAADAQGAGPPAAAAPAATAPNASTEPVTDVDGPVGPLDDDAPQEPRPVPAGEAVPASAITGVATVLGPEPDDGRSATPHPAASQEASRHPSTAPRTRATEAPQHPDANGPSPAARASSRPAAPAAPASCTQEPERAVRPSAPARPAPAGAPRTEARRDEHAPRVRRHDEPAHADDHDHDHDLHEHDDDRDAYEHGEIDHDREHEHDVMGHAAHVEDGLDTPIMDLSDEDAAADPHAAEEALLARCLAALDRKGQIVLYGPPGSGKGRLARRLAARLVEGGDGLRGHVAFHARWTYEDFVQGQLPDGQRRLGRFTAFCRKAAGRRGCSVMVIEDLQRARVADVMGEALVLLDQRGSEITLAGGGSLVIPPRVRLIATVDASQDRGVLSDPVLRARFAFVPVDGSDAAR